ncbi:porin AaxA [Chlamydia ibidis]|uniref:Porin n=2 Tax=Chlamydia ibidis TaxID=1405396 RepID=S7KJG3_9CHLA|nr:carbohydrate porin [Chlamydia ibidis]EPP34570.1 porin AaxA [Chlamydia ibidis]EQM62413.1 porin AaxA [Chlamydia ibidis 10-1398/6]
MVFFRSLLLTSLYACNVLSLSAYASCSKDDSSEHSKLEKRCFSSVDCSFNDDQNCNKSERRHVLSPVKEVLEDRPWHKGFSFTKLTQSLQNATNAEISLECGVLPQWFYPHRALGSAIDEESPSCQVFLSPEVTWELYNTPIAGTGTFEFSYTLIRYWKNNAENANRCLGIACEINDYSSRTNILSQLSFSQTFPGKFLTVCIGQYSLYNIDGTLYDNDQLTGFISYSLSQNASATYSSGSIGAYVQVNPIPNLAIQVGCQDAYNILGTAFELKNLQKNKYNFYGYLSWSPQNRFGSGQYSALVYATRKVPDQLSQTTGWSLNFGQDLGKKLYLFGRWNGATGSVYSINRSYVLGLASANPINRNSQDLLGIAAARNKVNRKVLTAKKVRKYETVIETFATVGFGPHFSVTPDLQIYIHPAQRLDKRSVRVYGIRANISI